MRILGIESSCDETAVAIVTDDHKILANEVNSQLQTHTLYGGVIPELSSREHLLSLEALTKQALEKANCSLEQIDGIAATVGPGLIGGVLVGATFAKALALYHRKPFIGINHLEGHALTARLTHRIAFPYLLLLVSGGHTQILFVKDLGNYELLGTTIDDALGEAFDKTARLMGLPYPGGPQIEAHARNGDKNAYLFPQPLRHKKGLNFSFSGLKTAVKTAIEKEQKPLSQTLKENIAASFQETVRLILKGRLTSVFQSYASSFETFVVAGGVAANQTIRSTLEELTNAYGKKFVAPPINLCTDNAAMIAWTGLEYLSRGISHPLDIPCRPRWPLNDIAQGK